MAPITTTNDDFVVLPIEILPTLAYPHSALHEVRVRRNNPKVPTANDSRSLFLKNIPVDSTEAHFRSVFTHLLGAGRFETITFEDDRVPASSVDPAQAMRLNDLARKRKRADVEDEERRREDDAAKLPEAWTRRLQKSSSTAVVLLADEKSVQLALKAIAKLTKNKRFPVWGEDLAGDVPPLGATWISEHLQLSRLNKLEAKTAVHGFFTAFNRKETEAAELAKRLRNEPDEDGFVTVTRGGRAAPASRNEAEEAKQRMIDRQSKKKSELKDFYRFQLREKRKEEQQALVRRFEQDRKRVSDMREKRGKFKPET